MGDTTLTYQFEWMNSPEALLESSILLYPSVSTAPPVYAADYV